MTDLSSTIEARFRDALAKAFGDEHRATDPLVRLSTDERFGDYQANVAMSLAKTLGAKPRDVAASIVAALDAADLFERVEIAGPGFINLTLTNDALGRRVEAMHEDERLGVEPAPRERIVVDYSGPNVAKEMHVGHLRSTCIGDAIARVLRFLGHDVIGQNHLGDWGTQFGMLIEYLMESGGAVSREIGDLNAFYQEAKRRFDGDPEFAERARLRVVALQRGDAETLELWRTLVDASKRYFDTIYERLDIDRSLLEYRGESAYNDDLDDVIRGLDEAGLLRESEGALVVYPQGFKGRDGEPLPMIVRKRDAGYLYATTDLAAARYRLNVLGATRVIYVTDARQSQHFAMLFQTLREAGWAGPNIRLDHVPFGTILGPDRKPFKTRSGDVVRLGEVIDEAEERAYAIVAEKNPSMPEEEKRRVAHVVGVGALKYADLASERIRDYVFDWNRMLSLDGNTAPYLQNAYVRIRSIFRKADADGIAYEGFGRVKIVEEAERALALKLLQLPAVVRGVAESLEPHRLCNYLYELASAYHRFYERCPVLSADDETRRSRLRLCDVTARTLKTGLELLGIATVEQM
ncbi:MAG: arginine--tRNA ligase [Gammaproteobacteria bacterium]|nr:arginine--tRNA ligase [Gammaproteobacteria bacterium]